MFDTIARLATVPGVSTASDLTRGMTAAADLLPVATELAGLLPQGGLRRGSTVAAVGSKSLLLALLAEATAAGSWAAVVGMPDIGVVAASELGVAVQRLALVADAGVEIGPVVAALLDGMDVVVVAAPMSERAARRLSAKARSASSVLLTACPWPGADVELRCTEPVWRGVDNGHGTLSEREVTVRAVGRAAAARPVSTRLLLPGRGGALESGELNGPFGAYSEPNGPFGASSAGRSEPNGPFGAYSEPSGPFGTGGEPNGPFGSSSREPALQEAG